MKVLTFSRHFPKGHPKAGQPTYFVEKILRGIHELRDEIKPLMDFGVWSNCIPKHHTIRSGSRFNPGDMASLRVWSGKPYRSKQIEFAQVEVKKVWEFSLYPGEREYMFSINDYHAPIDYRPGLHHHHLIGQLALNDGLTVNDFMYWFNIHPKKKEQVFTGQVISWSPDINY